MTLAFDKNVSLVGSLVCKHGTGEEVIALKRLIVQAELAQSFIDQLSLVMLPGFKDWHDNADKEKPEVAAFVITNLRQRLEWEEEETERIRRDLIHARFVNRQLAGTIDSMADELTAHALGNVDNLAPVFNPNLNDPRDI